MKKQMKCGIAGLLTTAAICASALTASAADVNVYAEGAYTDTELVVAIYADISPTPLVSAGVQLTYDNSKLALTSAERNEADWYFGTAAQKYPYQAPQDNGSAVIFLCGRIDEDNPTAGVSGTRKLIGKATFLRSETSLPIASPESYFGAALGLGIIRVEPAQFANFVTTGEAVLDNTAALDMTQVIIRERGDANGDGTISVQDILRAKTLIGTSDFPVYSDCNDSGDISVQDILCIKSKI